MTDPMPVEVEVVEGPLGPLLMVVGPNGVMRLAFEVEDHDAVLADLTVDAGVRVVDAGSRSAPVALQLREYLAGARTRFDVEVDLGGIEGFRRDVLSAMAEIPYGETATYASLAGEAGNPGAVRAVGTACARNPVPIIVPCHRVVRSDGAPGGYLGGTDAKQALLALERGVAARGS